MPIISDIFIYFWITQINLNMNFIILLLVLNFVNPISKCCPKCNNKSVTIILLLFQDNVQLNTVEYQK